PPTQNPLRIKDKTPHSEKCGVRQQSGARALRGLFFAWPAHCLGSNTKGLDCSIYPFKQKRLLDLSFMELRCKYFLIGAPDSLWFEKHNNGLVMRFTNY
ncbi:hypothetical protein V4D00_04865, partial [Ralstonia solanacearum]|uniref:hypothetical protein n=1 Tax=Ralstonia solanacearum TaxID=305 RepID=UPI002F95CD46